MKRDLPTRPVQSQERGREGHERARERRGGNIVCVANVRGRIESAR